MTITERIDKISDNTSLDLMQKPTMARIELTGICSLKCKYCYSKELYKNNLRQKFLNIEDFNKCLSFIDKLQSIKEIGLFYMGESSLHPQLSQYYKILKDRNFFTFLTTNGTNRDNVIKALPFIDSLKISWNYINEENFIEKTGKNKDLYYKIIDNINVFYEECHKLGKKLAVSTILDNDQKSYQDTLKLIKFDQHYWLPLQSQCGYVKTGNSGVIGQSENTVSPIPCWSLFKGLYIDVDLNVHICCYGNKAKHILFNINDGCDYFCDKLLDIRKQHLNGNIPFECKECLNQSII